MISHKMKKVPREAFRRQILVLLTVYFNTFILGTTFAWGSVAVYFFGNNIEMSADSSQLALIIGLPDVGRLILAIPGGILVDRFGTRKIVLVTAVLHSLGYLILSFCAQVNIIYIARFLHGITMALVNATAMICIGEIASPEIRAKLTGIYQLFMILGCGVQAIFLAFVPSFFTIQYCNLLLSLLPFVFFYWTLETPDYLISIRKYDEAKVNLKYMRPKYSETEIITEFEKTKKYIESEQENKKTINWFKFMKSARIRTPLITIFYLNFFGFGTGFYISLNYVTLIIPNGQYIQNRYFTFVFNCISLLILLMLPTYIEKFRRRVFFISGTLILALFNILQSVAYIFYSEFNNDVCKWLYIFFYVMNGLVTCGCVHPMISVARSEILPQSVRGLGNAIAVISQSLVGILLIFAFDYFWCNLDIYYNFILYSIIGLALFVIVYYRLPESRGKSLADIQSEQNS